VLDDLMNKIGNLLIIIIY